METDFFYFLDRINMNLHDQTARGRLIMFFLLILSILKARHYLYLCARFEVPC